MHELSLALEVCRQAEDVCEREGGVAINSVAVEVGEDAGVEIENFRFCLESLLRDPPFNGARAELHRTTGDSLRLAWLEVDDGRQND